MKTPSMGVRKIRAVALAALSTVGACGAESTGPGDTPGVPPAVTARVPASGSTAVSVLDSLVVTFDQPLDSASVAGAVTLSSGGVAVSGVTRLQGTHSVHFVPAWPLDFGATYAVELSASLRDVGGDPLGSSTRWSFTTAGAPLPEPVADSLRARVEVLAHDSLVGRGSGTAAEARAAAVIAASFDAWGLAPLGEARQQPFAATSTRTQVRLDSRNVLGVVPGVGALADEWVVVGAHYDHIGLRETEAGTLEIHNGADDNASGTSVVMELARVWSEWVRGEGKAGMSRRSVLFALWGAEEEGLLGSCHFVETATLPPSRMRALLNFDMVGRLRANTVEALGWESSAGWKGMLADANRPALRFENTTICQSCSDHACFRRAGVPYVWFFTGWHDQYHAPGDDAHLVNPQGMAAIARLSLGLLSRLAVTPKPPSFQNAVP